MKRDFFFLVWLARFRYEDKKEILIAGVYLEIFKKGLITFVSRVLD